MMMRSEILVETDLDSVLVFGTIQQYPKCRFTFTEFLNRTLTGDTGNAPAKDTRVSIIDGETRAKMSLEEVGRKALEMDLRSRCSLRLQRPVVCIRTPSSLNGLVAVLAAFISGCVVVPISWDVKDPMEISRVLTLSNASLYISTRESLWESEYSLARLKINGASIGGEGSLAPNCIDLFSPFDPAIERIPIPNIALIELEHPCVLFYDEQNKQLYEMTERSVLMNVLGSVRKDNPFWKERVISKLGALSLLTEVLPRILSPDSANSEEAAEEDEVMEGEKRSPMVIVFDKLYGTRVRRIVRARPGGRVGPARSLEVQQLPGHQPSDMAMLLLYSSGNRLTGSVSGRVGLRLPKTSYVETKQSMSPGARGRLAAAGPFVFRQVIGSVSRTVDSLFIDSRTGLVWYISQDEVQVGEDGSTLEFVGLVTSANSLAGRSTAGGVDWKRRVSVTRPPRRNGGNEGVTGSTMMTVQEDHVSSSKL